MKHWNVSIHAQIRIRWLICCFASFRKCCWNAYSSLYLQCWEVYRDWSSLIRIWISGIPHSGETLHSLLLLDKNIVLHYSDTLSVKFDPLMTTWTQWHIQFAMFLFLPHTSQMLLICSDFKIQTNQGPLRNVGMSKKKNSALLPTYFARPQLKYRKYLCVS